jgi:hypothetical protein
MAVGLSNPNNFQYTARERFPGVGRLIFACSWLLTIGLLNLFYAISVIAGSEIFITTASWLVGDARPWGWLMLLVGLTQIAAAPAVWTGRRWGFWVAVASICGHVAAQIMFIPESALIAITLLLLDAVVLFSLWTTVGEQRPRF